METMPRYYVWLGMENIMSGEVRDHEAARMRFCADKGLHVTRRLVDRFQHLDVDAGLMGNGRGPGDVEAGTKQGKMRLPPGDCPPHPPPRKLREVLGLTCNGSSFE